MSIENGLHIIDSPTFRADRLDHAIIQKVHTVTAEAAYKENARLAPERQSALLEKQLADDNDLIDRGIVSLYGDIVEFGSPIEKKVAHETLQTLDIFLHPPQEIPIFDAQKP